ncbi:MULTISPECIES: low temperature requirement protein A [unclassified Microcella]|uniref:low temperature requirement protein A n=1 Tax=unclassified Microcella TaxID=2630066 RepID=UPI0006FE1DAE|nr:MULTISPECIES: low temperature requirement protein A [unclassified Microcella]KQV26198.1 hypothetical protein ASC54_04570 [Yonghaparkia sp. Root332]KRF33006.1 hypothetical protein ASG83_03115 [Yonghaparkia sp. Soil809]
MPSPPGWGIRTDLLRRADRERGERVGFVELFFDLVFVLALTQVGAVVATVATGLHALHAVLVLVAVWWLWMHTTWVTNWLDPARLPVRLAIIALAGAGLVLSTAIVESLGDRALAFAIAYVGLQLARTAFMVVAAVRHDGSIATDFARMLLWFAASGVLWIGGAVVGAQAGAGALLAAWTLAALIDLTGPAISYALPGLGRGRLEGWDLSAHHFAERAALFVIIAIGEGFLVSGFAFVGNPSGGERNAALASAFVAAAALWWLYFDHGEKRGEERMEHDPRAGAIARAAYAYAHIPVIAGVVMIGAADKTIIAEPRTSSPLAIALVLGGPALFALGIALYRRIVGAPGVGIVLAAAGACAAFVPFSGALEPWVLSCLSTGVLVVACVADTLLRRRRGAPSLG